MLRLCIEAHERELGSDAPDTLNAQEGLARHFLAARDLQSAARVWREVAAARSCVQGATHPATIAARSRVLLLESGKNPEASLYGLNELFSVAMRDLGPGSSTTLDLARLLGSLYEGRGRHAEAEHLFAQLLGAQAAAPLSSAQDRAFNLFSLGRIERSLGRAELALSIYDEVHDLVETTPLNHPALVDGLLRESMSAREDSGDLEGALRQGRDWLARTPAEHPVRPAVDADVLRLELQLANR
jgi:tetratricopeptide (TPR) repeat protein